MIAGRPVGTRSTPVQDMPEGSLTVNHQMRRALRLLDGRRGRVLFCICLVLVILQGQWAPKGTRNLTSLELYRNKTRNVETLDLGIPTAVCVNFTQSPGEEGIPRPQRLVGPTDLSGT